MSTELRQVNESAALSALCGDRQLLSQLAQIFVEEAPILLQKLETAVISDDIELAQRLTHSLKGLTSMFFAGKSTMIASQIEDELCSGTSEYLPCRIDDLKRSIEALIEELRALGHLG